MIRLIKRYGGGSRKLYDTEESRYVSLDELAAWIRAGQELQVVDSATGEDVTAQTLTQSLYEEQKRGYSQLTREFLHDVIRKSGQALSARVEQVQARMDRMVRASVETLNPTLAVQEEMHILRQRMLELETALQDLEVRQKPATEAGTARKPRRTSRTPRKP